MLRFHDTIKEVVWQACRAAGHFALKEQVVPQWGVWRQRGRGNLDWQYTEAILDVVSFDPGSLQHLHVDTTVRNSLGKRYLDAGSATTPGVAMSIAARDKEKRYPAGGGMRCTTAAVDQFGYIDEDFLVLLSTLACMASVNDASHGRPRCNWLRKWLRHLSSGLAVVQATIPRW